MNEVFPKPNQFIPHKTTSACPPKSSHNASVPLSPFHGRLCSWKTSSCARRAPDAGNASDAPRYRSFTGSFARKRRSPKPRPSRRCCSFTSIFSPVRSDCDLFFVPGHTAGVWVLERLIEKEKVSFFYLLEVFSFCNFFLLFEIIVTFT